MAYLLEACPKFAEDYKRRCSENNAMKRAVDAKVKQICELLEENPNHFKPLKGRLAGFRRVHVFTSFVLVFQAFKETKTVKLVRLAHHDEAY